MIFRCKSCQGTVWLQAAAPTACVKCAQCRQRYEIDSGRRRQIARGGLSGQARKLAKRESLDLPGSYSVLLGIMTAEEVRELGCAGSVACAVGPEREDGYRPLPVQYDPAFQQAVEAGHLTPKQALERGQREVYATFLANRHRLPKEIADRVADNRISLLDAVRRFRRQSDRAVVLAPPMLSARPSSRASALFAIPLVAMLSFAYLDSGSTDRSEPARVQQIGSAQIETDARGRIVKVLGPSPQSVLNAYCESGGPNRRLVPLQVAAHSSRGPRARLGLLLDRADTATLLAITILENRDANHWSSGDGRQPLAATAAPDGAERAVMQWRSVAQASAPLAGFGTTLRGGFGFAPQSTK